MAIEQVTTELTEPQAAECIDKQKVAAAFGRAAHSYEQHNELQRRSGNALLARLPEWADTGLDLGCGSGWFAPRLKLKARQLLALDLSPDMLQQATKKADITPICADMDAMPLPAQSLDWIFANLCLQWSADPAAWLKGWSERLKPGGVLVFSTLLAGSLHELESSWQQLDGHAHINRFIAPDTLEQQLTATGRRWQLEQVDEQLCYPKLKGLLLDLKGIGANRVNGDRRPGLMGKQAWQRLNLIYPKNNQGHCVATYRLAYGVIYG
ncbi:malonyl-ACP O-methyltransferase BioC [Oceanisphaera arctica]|uniref:Malonyl-[acyl-carrier protein] O-methyltransferase n=1 Tax=Oceanisphaera arctica TaxID=641510 RepID=A0A2P5TIJ4_9GAMM|nr:malonyl-ACP O-methyltransferase BioC [Oceanisphaera arctica]PPL14591.1 malonyl-[acyl-carrier protein] O-methyltransferase BioC [Oceanisphaera arctica]GHA17749.1 malonyl-[acyl-carrier protein] O-methyltransferase [Oceanisphaera arctica]